MERLVDKSIIAACCLTAFLTLPLTTFTFAGYLVALALAALNEALPRAWRLGVTACYFIVAIACPTLAAFLPLIAYDCVREESWPIQLAWIIPLLGSLRSWDTLPWLMMALFCVVAGVLSRRTASLVTERDHFRKLRDDAHEASIALEARNRNLQEARELSAQVATLAERGRIAREIHDNVGHLLTRAIMQVEALKVVHAQDPALEDEFDMVATTLNEAMQTVRASVHDLRDTASDPRVLMQAALDGTCLERTSLTFGVDELPDDIARCFVAIVREAATNTVRHSNATHIEVNVQEHPGLYQLIVQDNGAGNTKAAPVGVGMGLQTMNDRVRALGGTLRTASKDGFRVFVSIPK